MSEDISIQPSEDTNASEEVQQSVAEATSSNGDAPIKPPESSSEDVHANTTEKTSTDASAPATTPEITSANEEAPVDVSEDAGVSEEAGASEEAPLSSEETSEVEEVPLKSLENTHEAETVPASVAEVASASEDTAAVKKAEPVKVPARKARTEPLWLNIVKRVLVGIVMVLTIVGLLIDMAQLVGVWAAYGPTRDGVISASNTMQQGLQVAEKGLTRANGYVIQGRQVVTQVNDVVSIIGDKVQSNSPIINALVDRINTRFGPSLQQAQSLASTVHDAALKVNGALEIINRFPGVSVPTFNDQLTAISNRAQQSQSAMQDLRTTLINAKTGAVTKLSTKVTLLTGRVDSSLAQIQSIINTYQTKVTNAQNRLTTATNKVLTLLLVTAISVTILTLVVAAALLLLFLVCLQFVIHGHFPSLRVVVNK